MLHYTLYNFGVGGNVTWGRVDRALGTAQPAWKGADL